MRLRQPPVVKHRTRLESRSHLKQLPRQPQPLQQPRPGLSVSQLLAMLASYYHQGLHAEACCSAVLMVHLWFCTVCRAGSNRLCLAQVLVTATSAQANKRTNKHKQTNTQTHTHTHTLSLSLSLSLSLTHSLTPSLPHSLTPSLPHSLTHSLTHSLMHTQPHYIHVQPRTCRHISIATSTCNTHTHTTHW